MLLIISILLAFVAIHPKSYAECPNACSAHGSCGQFDMCTCYRNWMGSDCSQRVCLFGTSFVDTPKGDLDGSLGRLSGTSKVVVVNDFLYPYGTTEQYPNIVDTNGVYLEDSAHEYRECSNAGLCDREFGECVCFPGYEGPACNRVSCPKIDGVVCSGYGICATSKEYINGISRNVYSLWDSESVMGCVCDPGYYGSACENRLCKQGFDPILVDYLRPRFANWTLSIFANCDSCEIVGNYSLKLYDNTGMSWLTKLIEYDAPCSVITEAIESIPNNVFAKDSILCLKFPKSQFLSLENAVDSLDLSRVQGIGYTIAFPLYPGHMKQPSISVLRHGSRPTLYTNFPAFPVFTAIYPNGFVGETEDYFTTRCDDVEVNLVQMISSDFHFFYLGGLTPIETRLLQRCLGDSDGNADEFSASGRVRGLDYTWDYGDFQNPHIVKLIDLTLDPVSDLCPGSSNSARGSTNITCEYPSQVKSPGFYAPLYFDPADNLFKVFVNAGIYYSENTKFRIYTTEGVLQMVSPYVDAISANVPSGLSSVIYTVNSSSTYSNYDGDLSCESNGPNINGALDCIEKNDIVTFFSPYLTADTFSSRLKYLNLYAVDKISRLGKTSSSAEAAMSLNEIVLDLTVNRLFKAGENIKLYKFKPPNVSLKVVSQCSNRGSCDEYSGVCNCYKGFTSDSCSVVYSASL